MEKTINISKTFSQTPGARYRTDGPFSGEQFREEVLEPLFTDENISKILIDLDGTEGYATSFLEEAFGGLARRFTAQKCMEKLSFLSNEDPLLIDEIFEYIESCCE